MYNEALLFSSAADNNAIIHSVTILPDPCAAMDGNNLCSIHAETTYSGEIVFTPGNTLILFVQSTLSLLTHTNCVTDMCDLRTQSGLLE